MNHSPVPANISALAITRSVSGCGSSKQTILQHKNSESKTYFINFAVVNWIDTFTPECYIG